MASRAFDSLRALGSAYRRTWERLRPLPAPRYAPGTPSVTRSDLGVALRSTVPTFEAAAMSKDSVDFVLGVLERLTPIDEVHAQKIFYTFSKEKYGKHWRYADLLTALAAAAYFLQPSDYLEIGVWRGRSAAVVGAMCPSCAISGFDLWPPQYGAVESVGPEFVRQELEAAGHTGDALLVAGDSSTTLPAFLGEHRDLYFDLITIDGQKTMLGVASDFAAALPRLKVGGIVLFDDLPVRPALRRVWERMVVHDSRYATWEYIDGTLGVAAAIRVSDGPASQPRYLARGD